jgi:hypothetical protein
VSEPSDLLGKPEQAAMFGIINRILRDGVLVFVKLDGWRGCAKGAAASIAPD